MKALNIENGWLLIIMNFPSVFSSIVNDWLAISPASWCDGVTAATLTIWSPGGME